MTAKTARQRHTGINANNLFFILIPPFTLSFSNLIIVQPPTQLNICNIFVSQNDKTVFVHFFIEINKEAVLQKEEAPHFFKRDEFPGSGKLIPPFSFLSFLFHAGLR